MPNGKTLFNMSGFCTLEVLTGNKVIYQVRKKILNLKLKGFFNFRLYFIYFYEFKSNTWRLQ